MLFSPHIIFTYREVDVRRDNHRRSYILIIIAVWWLDKPIGRVTGLVSCSIG